MKQFQAAGVLTIFAGLTLVTAAQNPPRSTSDSVRGHFVSVNRRVLDMAKDFPEDKYDFKPNPAQRSFAEGLLHACGVNYYFTNVVKGEKPPQEENPKRELFKTKSNVVAYVKKSFADGADAIKAKGDKGMGDLVTDPYSHDKVRVADYAYGFIEHSGEHYGQLVVYYRVAGMVPPESRPKKQ